MTGAVPPLFPTRSKRPVPRKKPAQKRRRGDDVIKAQGGILARVEGKAEVVRKATGRFAKVRGEEDEGNDAHEAPGRWPERRLERKRGRDRHEDGENESEGVVRGAKRRRDTAGEMQRRGDGVAAGGTDAEDGRHRLDTPGGEIGPRGEPRKGSEPDAHTEDRGVDNEGDEGRRSRKEDRKHEDPSPADGTAAGRTNAGGKENGIMGGGESGGGCTRTEERPSSPALSCTSSSAPSWKDSELGTTLGAERREGASSPPSAASSIEDGEY